MSCRDATWTGQQQLQHSGASIAGRSNHARIRRYITLGWPPPPPPPLDAVVPGRCWICTRSLPYDVPAELHARLLGALSGNVGVELRLVRHALRADNNDRVGFRAEGHDGVGVGDAEPGMAPLGTDHRVPVNAGSVAGRLSGHT